MNLVERDKKVVWHPFTQVKTERPPIPIVKAQDSLLYDEKGNTYIDCNSSWWVNVHGHGCPQILEAIQKQFLEIDHVLLAGVTHPKAVELAEKVIDFLPKGFEKVFYSDNGSTAVEVALKMVMQYWYNQDISKKRILALEGAYHGDTFGAMSMGERGYFNKPFEDFFFEADFLPFPTAQNEKDVLEKARLLFETKTFAGLIVEPLVQGSAGMRMYSATFLNQLMKLAKEHDVIIIFDEVMTGWGRTGKRFAMNYCDELPDIVCLSKGLTGGVLPLGLTVTHNKIFDAFKHEEKTKALLHGHSYTGNALACAAACASIDLFLTAKSEEDIQRITVQQESAKKRFLNHKAVSTARSLGTILAIEVKQEEESSYFSSIREKALAFFLENGMLLRPLGNVLFLNPPYCTKNEQLGYCYDKMEAFLDSLLENID